MTELNNHKMINSIKQSLKQFNVDLTGLNILIGASVSQLALIPLMACFANARNIYVLSQSTEESTKLNNYINKISFSSNVKFIEKLQPHVLSQIDVLIKGNKIKYLDESIISSLKESCVIMVFPEFVDYNYINGISLEDCSKYKMPVIVLNEQCENLMIDKYFANVITKRCYEADLDVYKSKILLAGKGKTLDSALNLLKSAGAFVYVANTDKADCQQYVLKHLGDADAIIVAQVPVCTDYVIGQQGLITLEQIKHINPEVKIIHFAGKIDTALLNKEKIKVVPNNVNVNYVNVNINELGLKAVSDIVAALMKSVESMTKTKNKTTNLKDCVVSYKVMNYEEIAVARK